MDILIFLVIYGFFAYFLINVLRFMRVKAYNDKLIIQKLEEISTSIEKNSQKTDLD